VVGVVWPPGGAHQGHDGRLTVFVGSGVAIGVALLAAIWVAAR